MPTYTATGVSLVIHKYRGSERIISFFTRECGKVEAVARGVGKPGSSLAPAAEPFTLSRLFLVEARNLDRLTQCEVLNSFYGLRGDLSRFAHASYVAEITSRTTEPGQPHPELFDHLLATLTALETGDDPQKLTAAYMLRLLNVLGVAPMIDTCVACGAALGGPSVYSPVSGGLVCRSCQPPGDTPMMISPAACGVLRSLQSLPPERLERLRIDAVSRRQIAAMLKRHVEYHLGLQLRSEEFINQLKAGEPR